MQQEEIDLIKGYRTEGPEKTKDIWDFFDECDKRRAARSRTRKAWDGVSNWTWRLWNNHLAPDRLWWKVVSFFQRRRRGFDDSELWSLDDTILQFILPRLKRFRAKERVGWPGPQAIFNIDYDKYEALSDEEQDDLSDRSLEEWDRILDKMIRAIELQVEDGGTFFKLNPEWKEGDPRRDQFIGAPELEEEYKEGWDLFIKWFHALWD